MKGTVVNTTPDVVVIGAGAGGLTAARQARRMGASVLLVADGPLGGDCTHTGCVPSKTLIAAAARHDDFAAAITTVHATVGRIADTEDAEHLTREGIEVARGRARLTSAASVDVDGTTVRGNRIIIATGARPSLPPVPGLTAVAPLTNETVFDLTSLPSSLVVIGAGAIGCELAQAFARFGSTVTLLDVADRVLTGEEPEASAVVDAALRRAGADIRVGVGLESASATPSGVRIALADGTSVDASSVLVAAGRRAVTEGLGADTVGLELNQSGQIVVDDTCATNVDGIWAIGDVTQHGGFTHMAGHMGYVAARNATRTRRLTRTTRIDTRAVPRVTYTDPEVASIGMTEAQAAEHGGRVAHLPMDRVDRAITAGRTEGFVKLIAGPRPIIGDAGGGRILGATIVAPTAGELIHEPALAIRTNMFAGRLAQTIHAYPTWSMAIQQAATQFFQTTEGLDARPANATP